MPACMHAIALKHALATHALAMSLSIDACYWRCAVDAATNPIGTPTLPSPTLSPAPHVCVSCPHLTSSSTPLTSLTSSPTPHPHTPLQSLTSFPHPCRASPQSLPLMHTTLTCSPPYAQGNPSWLSSSPRLTTHARV